MPLRDIISVIVMQKCLNALGNVGNLLPFTNRDDRGNLAGEKAFSFPCVRRNSIGASFNYRIERRLSRTYALFPCVIKIRVVAFR